MPIAFPHSTTRSQAMRHVFNNQQCVHVWAQQTQDSGSGNGAVRFSGTTLYSYAARIARFVTRNHKRAVLVSKRTYSPTTQKHISYARQSIPDEIPVFTVSDPAADPQDHAMNRIQFMEGIASCVKHASRAR